MKSNTPKNLTLTAMFAAIIFILAFTPIGFIQLPFIKATIIHIPVIIGSIMLGAKYGSILGFLFGLVSLINNTMAPALLSFAFSPFVPIPGTDSGSPLALVVCFVPRILVGIFPWYVYNGLNKLFKNTEKTVSFAVAGVVGSFTNTLLVMHFIFFLFKAPFAAARDIALDTVYSVVLGVIAVNGIPEAIVAAICTVAICVPLKLIVERDRI
jgi:uncharacterized membrane protein